MKEEPANRPARVGLISLGCAKNLVDAEVMVGTLLQAGLEITTETAQADVVIVNTCAFIDAAKEESVDAILQSAEWRNMRQRGQGLIVAGCLPQRFRDQLPALLSEVDTFLGIDEVPQVATIVRQVLAQRFAATQHVPRNTIIPASPLVTITPRPRYLLDCTTPRFRLTPRHLAYVKIAEGCNHPCSFCVIPRIRGRHRSRLQADIVGEAKALVADGVRELNLISQDSTYYGMDLQPDRGGISAPERFDAAVKSFPVQASTICTLLRELSALPGDFWIRLLYTHPAHWTDELIQTIAECPKVARYVDIPLQHIHPNMLERMRRETSRQYIAGLIRRIRAGIPGIALRTTFIVGFPGETEACFEDLLDFIRETRFERLGVFTYSREEGTRAGKMAGQIPERIKQKRRNLAMTAQHNVAAQIARSFVGRRIGVLVEGVANSAELRRARVRSWEHGLIRGRDQHASVLKGRFLVARGEADAPDIDGRVYVRGELPLGEFAQVEVVGHTDYDLIAEPCRG
ncbi:MAG TPA: 30S ribosomal protein S12 methylthiotransferase RimO [Verrucomicrobiota bacterium]|nr:30S ribosomal protein S12 methylthiotransferase RimO [Verrucomicrobiota bacterium]HQL80445.1 30S ribosomal protein S12 methylthiotransferase RimO [Verrucomicrobiota bacterium]